MRRTPPTDLERRSIDTIRVLAMDSVQKANAGHPGTAMALAPLAYMMYTRAPAAQPGRTPPGPTATASCSQPATPACCSTPRST